MNLNLGDQEPVVDECEQCSNITEEGVCKAYLYPSAKWARGKKCPLATHLRVKVMVEEKGRKRVGQQKQVKKKRR